MITKDNLQDVINLLSDKEKRRIKNTDKEYILLELICTNNSAYTYMKLTNNTPFTLEAEQVILYVSDVLDLI